METGALRLWPQASLCGARSAQYGAEGASSAKRTRDEAVQYFSGAVFLQ